MPATKQQQKSKGSGPSQWETIKTWPFNSVGNKKYALQIQKASNDNPCLRIVQGSPKGDGTYRKFDITIWSEDFDALFETLDEVRSYMKEHDIKTPPGHKWQPYQKGKKYKPAQ